MNEVNTWPGWSNVRQIGAGSFGRVYEIEKTENGVLRKAALKVMSVPASPEEVQSIFDSGMASTEEDASTYIESQIDTVSQEFKMMAELRGNPNIVALEDYQVIPHDGWMGADILIRMELLTPLNRYMRVHPLDEADVVRLGVDMCRALEACQAKTPPILHRDIKAANIMVDDAGHFKLGDFGVARVMEGTRSAHTKAGTEDYMAPEVLQMKGYFATADIYSLGIVLYKMLNNNRNPFLPTEGSLTEKLQLAAKNERLSGKKVPPPLNGSEELKTVVLRALEYDPKDRYQTATEFRWALEQCNSAENTISSEPTVEERKPASLEPNPYSNETMKDDAIPSSTVLENAANSSQKSGNSEKPFPLSIVAVVLVLALVFFAVVFVWPKMATLDPDPAPAPEPDVSSEEPSGYNSVPVVEDCEVTTEKQTIEVGETTDLAFETGGYIYRSDDSLTWTSGDTAVATVDSNGIVTGVSVGTVTITGTFGDLTTDIKITVEEKTVQDEAKDNNSETPAASNNSSDKTVESLEVYCYTNELLVGDSINTRLKADDWILDGSSASIKWSTDNTAVASVNSQGVLTAYSAGTCNLVAEYGGKTASQKITVVAVDKSSGATVSADYEKISLSSYGEDTVNLTFGGDMPEHFGAAAYYSAGVSLKLEWGQLSDNSISLTITDVFSAEKEGYVTVLAYEQEDPEHIVASTKIHVRINQ